MEKDLSKLSNSEIKKIQQTLVDLGHLDPYWIDAKGNKRTSVDGMAGWRTKQAYEKWQKAEKTMFTDTFPTDYVSQTSAGYQTDFPAQFVQIPMKPGETREKGHKNPSTWDNVKDFFAAPYKEESTPIGLYSFGSAPKSIVEESIQSNQIPELIRGQNEAEVTKYLIDSGFATQEDAKGGWGPKMQANYERALSIIEPLSLGEYLYRSGSVGFRRRLDNAASVIGNMIHGFLFPKSENATLSEGGRRQLIGASLENNNAIDDNIHERLGGISKQSGDEFREQSSIWDYINQAMDAPYHNIYGQTAVTSNDGGKTFFVGADANNPDAYTFNNQWRGDKVIKEFEDGEGTGSFWDAIREFRNARKSGASWKAAFESGASVRGTDVQANNRTNHITSEDRLKYEQEYQDYLNLSPENERNLI